MLHRLAAVLLTAPLLALVGPGVAPAGAVTYAEANATNAVVKYTGCDRARVSVSGDWADDVYNEVQVDVLGPDGRRHASRTFFDNDDGSVDLAVRLCARDRAGKYRVEASAIGYDEEYQETSRVVTATSFKFRYIPKARTRFPHRVWFRPNRSAFKYDVVAKLLREGRAYRSARVIAAARIDGDWYKIDKARTNRRGLVGWRFKPNPFKWCFYFPGDRRTQPVATRPFRTPRRSNARAASADLRTLTVENARRALESAAGQG